MSVSGTSPPQSPRVTEGRRARHSEEHEQPVDTQRLFGFDFINDSDCARTVERILGGQPRDRWLPMVVTPNVDDIVRLNQPRHAGLADAERRSRYVLPDGQPIVWISRLAGRSLAGRLPGSSLFPALWEQVSRDRRRAVVVAPAASVGEALRREHPDVAVVVPPYFEADDDAQLRDVVAECRHQIERVDAELVFIGIGFPKQQRIALAVIDQLQAAGRPLPLFLLIGGSIDLYLGRVPRAPDWIQRLGLEWFYRFLREPRRLFRRYFVTDMKFFPLAAKELFRARSSRIDREVTR
jgi:N-acetylglucosaminyldiphosphoundecaprenol N-acetyl-beta-D-mannosaminyltransferase